MTTTNPKQKDTLLRTWTTSAEKIRAVANYLRLPIVNVIDESITLYYDKVMRLERVQQGMIIVDNDHVIVISNEEQKVTKTEKGATTLYDAIREHPNYKIFDYRTVDLFINHESKPMTPEECIDVGELSK